MPINMDQVNNDKRTITFTYFGEEGKVTYMPSKLTPTVEDALRDAQDNSVLIKTLCSMITDWEVVDGSGETLPIEPDTMMHMSNALLGAILQACREDMLPKSKIGRR